MNMRIINSLLFFFFRLHPQIFRVLYPNCRMKLKDMNPANMNKMSRQTSIHCGNDPGQLLLAQST